MKEATENLNPELPTLVLSQQVLAWLLVATVSLGSLLGGSYLAYRGMNPPQTVLASGRVKPLPVIQAPKSKPAPAAAPVAQTAALAPAPVAQTTVPAAQTTTPAAVPPAPKPAAPAPAPVALSTAAAATQPALKPPAPPQPAPAAKPLPVPDKLTLSEADLRGKLVLQVGNIDKPTAENFARSYLARGLPARLLETSTGQSFRVVLGPYTPQELQAVKSRLDAEGLQSFARQF